METNSIGQSIKALREKASLTQEELALKMDIPLDVLIDWEVDYGGPNGDQMMQLVDVFNVSYNELAGRVNKTTWSLKDGLIMGSLALGVVAFFQPILTTTDGSFNLIQLWLRLFAGSNGALTLGFTAIFSGASFLALLVMMFLSLQNPKKYTYHGNPSVALVSVLLLILTGILCVLINTYGELTPYTWILLFSSTLPLFFYYGFRTQEVK